MEDLYMKNSYTIRYFKEANRVNPLKLNPYDARKFTLLLRKELKRLNLYYKEFLNPSEIIFVLINGKEQTQTFIKKVRFKTIMDIIKENDIDEPYKIFVDDEPITAEEAEKKWFAYCDFISVIKT